MHYSRIYNILHAGAICGCEGWKQIKDFGEMKLPWLRQFLPYAEGIPVDDTIARVMRKLATAFYKKVFPEFKLISVTQAGTQTLT